MSHVKLEFTSESVSIAPELWSAVLQAAAEKDAHYRATKDRSWKFGAYLMSLQPDSTGVVTVFSDKAPLYTSPELKELTELVRDFASQTPSESESFIRRVFTRAKRFNDRQAMGSYASDMTRYFNHEIEHVGPFVEWLSAVEPVDFIQSELEP